METTETNSSTEVQIDEATGERMYSMDEIGAEFGLTGEELMKKIEEEGMLNDPEFTNELVYPDVEKRLADILKDTDTGEWDLESVDAFIMNEKIPPTGRHLGMIQDALNRDGSGIGLFEHPKHTQEEAEMAEADADDATKHEPVDKDNPLPVMFFALAIELERWGQELPTGQQLFEYLEKFKVPFTPETASVINDIMESVGSTIRFRYFEDLGENEDEIGFVLFGCDEADARIADMMERMERKENAENDPQIKDLI